MNIKSLHAVIPNNNDLQALIYHLHQHLLQQPLKDTLVGLAENAYYHQVAGVATGTKLGPIYASPFVWYVERRMKTTKETSLNFTNVVLVIYVEHPRAHYKIFRSLYNFAPPTTLLSSTPLKSASLQFLFWTYVSPYLTTE